VVPLIGVAVLIAVSWMRSRPKADAIEKAAGISALRLAGFEN
jgi:hypothetical protein